MTNSDAPKDGDFAAYLERKVPATPRHDAVSATPAAAAKETPSPEPAHAVPGTIRQTINDVLVDGEEPTDEFLAEINALESAEPLSDEEFDRQALEHPGEDGDPRTPE
jgi:hypothetical protein